MTLKQFIEETNCPESIVRAVARQLGGWNEDTRQSMKDIARHGIDGGFPGFIYYVDTVAFFKRNRKAILDYAREYARDLGYDGEMHLFSTFNCMNGFTQDEIARAIYTGKGACKDQILNCLAWFAGEEVSRSYYDICEG